ncbi:MAG: MarR family transcriptional regulator [Bacteroidales bacterium]|jgi:DNA-binding MarR family transcriptional regulator|nr:MarR family transcriptional regulator [Bacteroidales bacterium]
MLMQSRSKEGLSLRNQLGVELMETYNTLNDKSIAFFAKYGITSQQYNVLAILYLAGSMSTSNILEWMFEKNAGVSRLVDRLVKKQLVVKKPNKTDKRLIVVSLTEKGRIVYENTLQNLKELENNSKNLSDEEVEQLIKLLLKLKGE